MPVDILAVGEPLFEFSQVNGEDGTSHYLPGFGGDTSNFAVAAARQGARVGYFTRLGEDTFGDAFMRLWQEEAIDTSGVIRDAQAPTGIYFITHDERGHTFSYFRAGSAASRLKPKDVPEEAVAGAKVLHASGISQAISTSACDSVFKSIEIARARGVKVSYDPNLRLALWPLARARAIIHETISRADICLPSLEDASALTGLDDPDAVVDFYLDRGAGIVALKLGSEGAVVADSHVRHRLAGLSVDALDATGAGDTFDGTFVARLLENGSLLEAARYANAAAALTTTGYGAVMPIPDREAVESFLRHAS